MERFVLQAEVDERDNPSTRIGVDATGVPNGKVFVIEYVSGKLVVSDYVTTLYAYTYVPGEQIAQQVNLDLGMVQDHGANYGGTIGIATTWQFGGPTPGLYCPDNGKVGLLLEGQICVAISGYFVGHLV